MLSTPHTHQQMGKVKRHHRYIVDTVLVDIPKFFWDYRAMVVVHIYNLNSTVLLDEKSPLETMFGITHDHHNMKFFDCKTYPCMRV